MKDHHNGTGTSGLGTKGRLGAPRNHAIVRTGHPALDAAIASDRSAAPDLQALKAACRNGSVVVSPAIAEGTAPSVGTVATAMSLTLDRDGAGTTMHVATEHGVVDARGRARTIRVWHELGTQGCN